MEAQQEPHQNTQQTQMAEEKEAESTTKNQVLETEEKYYFDPFAKADFTLAEMHMYAKLVRRLDDKNLQADNRCLCCMLPYNAPQFGMCDSIFDLQELGPGFPLYYQLLQTLIWVLVLGIALVGAPCLIGNLSQDSADEWDADNDSFTVRSSPGNYGDHDEIIPFWQHILNIVFMAMVLIIYHILRPKLRQMEVNIDMMINTPSDYTCVVKGLGKNFTAEEVKEFFQNYGRWDGKTAEVVKVNIAYNIRDFVDVEREKIKAQTLLAYIEEYRKEHDNEEPTRTVCCCCQSKLEDEKELQKIVQDCDEKLQQYEREQKAGVGRDLLVGIAFVTFKTQQDARQVSFKFNETLVRRALKYIWYTFTSCCQKEQQEKKLFKGRMLYANLAPEPGDILWENLDVTFTKRMKNVLLTWLVTLIALGISFGMVYGCSLWQDSVYNDFKDDDNAGASDQWNVRINSIWPSIIIVFINFALARGIRYFSAFEKHHTMTDYHTSVALKLTVAQCVNTALIAIIVNSSKSNWFVPGGLIVDMTWILLANAIVQPAFYLFNPPYMIKKCRRAMLRGSDKIMTQKEANDIFEGPQVDMAQRYANIMKTIIVTFAYAPIIPLGFFISAFGLFFEYWVDKFVLLNRHARPIRFGAYLSGVMTKLIPYSVLIYSITNYIFISQLSEDQSLVSLIVMLSVIFYFIIPLDRCMKRCGGNDEIDKQIELSEEYEKIAVNFIDDYDRENPVTRDEGYNYFINLLQQNGLIDESSATDMRQDMRQDLPQSVQQGISSLISQNIKSYANDRVGIANYVQNAYNPGIIGYVPQFVNNPNRNVVRYARPAAQQSTAPYHYVNAYLQQRIGQNYSPYKNYGAYNVSPAIQQQYLRALQGTQSRGIQPIYAQVRQQFNSQQPTQRPQYQFQQATGQYAQPPQQNYPQLQPQYPQYAQQAPQYNLHQPSYAQQHQNRMSNAPQPGFAQYNQNARIYPS